MNNRNKKSRLTKCPFRDGKNTKRKNAHTYHWSRGLLKRKNRFDDDVFFVVGRKQKFEQLCRASSKALCIIKGESTTMMMMFENRKRAYHFLVVESRQHDRQHAFFSLLFRRRPIIIALLLLALMMMMMMMLSRAPSF